jgi:3-oxoacyl-[acyl-carrier-protein] synthase II
MEDLFVTKTTQISGYGIVSPLGNNVTENIENLMESKSNIRLVPEWSKIEGLQCHLGSFADQFDGSVIARKKRRTMSKMSEMMAVACDEALEQAGLTKEDLNKRRTLIIIGSTTSSLETLETSMLKFNSNSSTKGQLSTAMFKGMSHSLSLNLASYLDFKGQVICVASACSTSAQAMLLGHQYLQAGLCDLVLAGGADEIHLSTCISFDTAKAAVTNYNHEPKSASRPFDQNRTGIVVAEGASIVVMEKEADAKDRKALALGSLLGGSHNCDASNLANSSSESIKSNIEQALVDANVKASDIGYVNAHATSTIVGDILEGHGIYDVFGGNVPVSSFKGNFGHTLAACGALEVILTLEGYKRETLIGTKNLEVVDEKIPKLNLITDLTKINGDIFLSNNFAMGGQNVSLVVRNQ